MRRLRFAVLGFLALCGCGGPTATLFGFAVDGLSGQRLSFFGDGTLANTRDDPTSLDQIWAVVNGQFVRAVPCDAHDATVENRIDTSGCYRIVNLGSVEAFPVFAKRSGYQPFEARVSLAGASGALGSRYGNIRMFPLGYQVSYELVVSYQGGPVPSAAVSCRARASNAFQQGDDFLVPEVSTTQPALAGVTDAAGLFRLDGASLATGGYYDCDAYLRDQLEQDVLSGSVEVIAGVSAPHVSLPLSNAAPDPDALYAVRSSADNADDLLGNNASLTVTLNRPVELVPGAADCWTATLDEPDSNGNSQVGALPISTFNNGASEQVNASVSSDGLTLTVMYRAPTTALDTGDRGTSVVFGGIYLRPLGGSTDGAAVRNIGGSSPCGADNAPPFSTAPPLANLRTQGPQSATLHLF
ncbi:MAG TPA: hypothetical protein VND93_02955 [Myxococcales bacterium]|nr:hypothetical protein [Myxococcales bacterium]